MKNRVYLSQIIYTNVHLIFALLRVTVYSLQQATSLIIYWKRMFSIEHKVSSSANN